jgi:hypothetical protein
MKKPTSVLFIIFVSVLLIGCTDDLVTNSTEVVEAEIKDDKLEVVNNTNSDIYYYTIEQEMAAVSLIEMVSSDENRIEAESRKGISLSDIMGYEQGKKIIFAYWVTEDPSPEDSESRVIE